MVVKEKEVEEKEQWWNGGRWKEEVGMGIPSPISSTTCMKEKGTF